MRVLVIGAGEVGQHLGKTLSDMQHDVTLVDSDEERARALESELDALVITGNGASPKELAEIGAGDIDLLLAVTQIDEVNIIAALVGHQLGAKRTVARVRDRDYFGGDESFASEVLGIDFVINPERATALDLFAAIDVAGAVHVEYFADGQLAIAECILTEDSPLIDVPIAERECVRPHFIAGFTQDGEAQLADGQERLGAGDHILVTAARQDIGPVASNLSGYHRKVKHVMLFGGGKIAYQLAPLLIEAGIEVRIVEPDAERARRLAEKLPEALVLNEEGVGKQTLARLGAEGIEAFIACAGDDRTNLLAALNAKQLGAGLVMTVVSREEFVPLVPGLGLDAGYAPRLITAEAILKFVHSDSLHQMHLMLSGFEVLDLQASDKSAVTGRPLGSEGLLPEGCRVGTILRDGEVVMPSSGQLIQSGDRVLVVGVAGASAKAERAFGTAR